jgi:hypothetical protein
MPKMSRYIRLALKYCEHENLFTIDPITKYKIMEPEDIWFAILEIVKYENRNRNKKEVEAF